MHAYPRTRAFQEGLHHRFRRNLGGEVAGNGLSAYEVAVSQGFVGSESAWLDSLVGPMGPVGAATATFETVNRNLEAVGASTEVDDNGVVQQVSYDNGIVKLFDYDTQGRITSITLAGSTPAGIDLVKTFTHAADGSFDWSYS